jgi:hypothetical protein
LLCSVSFRFGKFRYVLFRFGIFRFAFHFAFYRYPKKKHLYLTNQLSLFNFLKIDKSAEAKRISSQIVKTVIDRTVYHGTNFAPDIVNEIVNNVTRDVGSKLQ